MNKIFSTITILFLSISKLEAQMPNPALIGYWQNWNNTSAPYIELSEVDSRYNVINVAFALPKAGTDYYMEFVPDKGTPKEFKSKISELKNKGKKVLISVGGATAPITLSNNTERDSFVSSLTNIINYYEFDGIDIDFEGTSLSISGGTIANPTDAGVGNLIDAIKQIMSKFRTKNNKKLLLSMAPETAFVQGGMSAYSGIWGAYLPVINALRDSIDILQVQLYNSGTMYGIDSKIYSQSTPDFIIAMTEAVIQGFNTTGGKFDGLPANKISVALPACSMAAGGGFADTATVKKALEYIMGKGNKPGSYILSKTGGYSDLRGMTTWSINWDAVNTCGTTYEFAQNFERIFKKQVNVEKISNYKFEVYPNPAETSVNITIPIICSENQIIEIIDFSGKTVIKKTFNKSNLQIDVSSLNEGLYYLKINNYSTKLHIQR